MQLRLPEPWTGPGFGKGLPDWVRDMQCPVCGGMVKYRLTGPGQHVDIARCWHLSFSVSS